MSANRLVSTRAIQAAVQDRETEVLDRLGLDWRSGRPHISCPYPSHSDHNPSWRWDEKRARALCTCIPSSHSIFDVVAAIESCDFAAAKVRVAELLGLTDLIRTQEEPASGTASFLATDARSLMTAPASLRDDSLPVRYLAFRLGIDPAQVPLPATPMVGLKALGYYDPPPAGSKAKPKQVGLYPCAVFATIDAQGNTHAHRIYLAPEGQGKANLGTGPDGHPRDPKKSARTIAGDHTAGRSVIWGDPTRAPRIILCEGIETAAAVALAFLAEILAGTIAVAAAISATGLEAFQPWPATRSVIVGADRDEGVKENGKPGSGRGETAARSFALAHHQTVTIGIALPGEPGETMDWLDLLRKTGVETVRTGILAAVPFQPTPKEQEEDTQTRRRRSNLEAVAETYPLPVLYTTLLSYRHTSNHEVWVHKCIGKDESGALKWQPVASPFGVTARLRHADQADAYGLRVVLKDMAGQPRPLDIDRATLARMNASDIRALLLAAGLRVEQDGEMIAVAVLKAAQPKREIVTVGRPGWHRINGVPERVFVTLAGTAIGAPEDHPIELAASSRSSIIATGGTLEGWRTATAAALAAPNCPHWALGIVAGFVAPLVSLLGLDTCGINLSGLSSAGKTTALALAVSAWSSPLPREGLLHSLRATDNALETLAQTSSGTILALDEIAHADGRMLARMIYSIAGGVGKNRMTQAATLRQRAHWQTFALMSGESSLEEKIRSEGGQFTAGLAVRIPDVDVTHINRQVDAATLTAIAGIQQNHGHAGPAFVAGLIRSDTYRSQERLREAVSLSAREIAGQGSDSARIRAAQPFALLLVAGELAKSFELIPAATDIRSMVTWAWQRFETSSDAAALNPEEQAINNIRTYIAERWDVTVKSIETTAETQDGARRINNRESAGWYDTSTIYLPTGRIREAAGNVLKERQIVRVLDERGYLARRQDERRAAVRWIPNIGAMNAYALTRQAFGRSTRLSEPDLAPIPGGRP